MSTQKKIDWSDFVLGLKDESAKTKIADLVNRTQGLTDQERWTLIEPHVIGGGAESDLPKALFQGKANGDNPIEGTPKAEQRSQQPQEGKPQRSIPRTREEFLQQERARAFDKMNSLQREQYYKRLEAVEQAKAEQ